MKDVCLTEYDEMETMEFIRLEAFQESFLDGRRNAMFYTWPSEIHQSCKKWFFWKKDNNFSSLFASKNITIPPRYCIFLFLSHASLSS